MPLANVVERFSCLLPPPHGHVLMVGCVSKVAEARLSIELRWKRRFGHVGMGTAPVPHQNATVFKRCVVKLAIVRQLRQQARLNEQLCIMPSKGHFTKH